MTTPKGDAPTFEPGKKLKMSIERIENGYLLTIGDQQWFAETVHEIAASTTVSIIQWEKANDAGA